MKQLFVTNKEKKHINKYLSLITIKRYRHFFVDDKY